MWCWCWWFWSFSFEQSFKWVGSASYTGVCKVVNNWSYFWNDFLCSDMLMQEHWWTTMLIFLTSLHACDRWLVFFSLFEWYSKSHHVACLVYNLGNCIVVYLLTKLMSLYVQLLRNERPWKSKDISGSLFTWSVVKLWKPENAFVK